MSKPPDDTKPDNAPGKRSRSWTRLKKALRRLSTSDNASSFTGTAESHTVAKDPDRRHPDAKPQNSAGPSSNKARALIQEPTRVSTARQNDLDPSEFERPMKMPLSGKDGKKPKDDRKDRDPGASSKDKNKEKEGKK